MIEWHHETDRHGRWGETWDFEKGEWRLPLSAVTRREMVEQRARASKAFPFVAWEAVESGELAQAACNQCGELFATFECMPGNSQIFGADMAGVDHHLVAHLFGHKHVYCPLAGDPLVGHWKMVSGMQIRPPAPQAQEAP